MRQPITPVDVVAKPALGRLEQALARVLIAIPEGFDELTSPGFDGCLVG